MEARLKEELDVEVELIGGERGVFDVIAEGELVFSKHSAGRYPDASEIIDLLRTRMQAQ